MLDREAAAYGCFRGDDDFTSRERRLLLRRRHLGVLGRRVGLGRIRLRRRVGSGLVHALDFGVRAQFCDIIGLRLARHIGLDLGLDLVEIRRLAVALFLDLDDVPAELRFHRIGDLARLEREGHGGNSGTIWSLVKKRRSPPSEAPGSLDFFLASSAKSAPFLSSSSTALASSSVSTRIWRA